MKMCPKCATVNDNAAGYCENCGESLAEVAIAEEKRAKKVPHTGSREDDIFVDQDESMTAVIGTNYLQSFLSGGSVSQSVGVLTQKRFYYKGRNFSGAGKDMQDTTEEGIVSIEDITFTMFSHVRKTGALVWALLLLAVGAALLFVGEIITLIGMGLMVASLPFFVSYFASRKSLFVISFPGGSFGFDIRYYPISDIRDFQRQVHLMKDQIKENA